MGERLDSGEIVKRALAYPHAVPGRSFIQVGMRTVGLEGEPGAAAAPPLSALDAKPRSALLAYASNAAPAPLARKLAPLPELSLPVLGAELDGFDVVYSAHVSPRGSVPGTLHPSPGTSVRVAVLLPSAEQLALLSASEPNYELTRLHGVELTVDPKVSELLRGARAPGHPRGWGTPLGEVDAYLSRHGCLSVEGGEAALAEIEARGRRLPRLRQPDVLERARAALRPDLTLERFVLDAVAAGGIAPLPRL